MREDLVFARRDARSAPGWPPEAKGGAGKGAEGKDFGWNERTGGERVDGEIEGVITRSGFLRNVQPGESGPVLS